MDEGTVTIRRPTTHHHHHHHRRHRVVRCTAVTSRLYRDEANAPKVTVTRNERMRWF